VHDASLAAILVREPTLASAVLAKVAEVIEPSSVTEQTALIVPVSSANVSSAIDVLNVLLLSEMWLADADAANIDVTVAAMASAVQQLVRLIIESLLVA
jgi:hypothetical protein